MDEKKLYDNIILKIYTIKEKLTIIKEYSKQNSGLSIDYIEKLNLFSNNLNNLEATANDLYDEFILHMDVNKLNNLDKNKLKNLIIEKKIHNMFIPYMLYLQVLLQNS